MVTAALAASIFLIGVSAVAVRAVRPGARSVRTAMAAPETAKSTTPTTPGAPETTTTPLPPDSPQTTTTAPARTASPAKSPRSIASPASTTTSSTVPPAPHPVPAACAKPPGVGSGPYEDADVVDMPNAPNAGGDTNYDYGDPAPVGQWVNDHPNVSIGPYVSGNHIYVGFSKDAESNLAALRHDTGEGSNVRGYRVKYSGAEISAVYQAIWADRDWLAQQGIELNGDGGDPLTDTADAMVSTADDHTCDVFLQRYGRGRFYLIEGRVIAT